MLKGGPDGPSFFKLESRISVLAGLRKFSGGKAVLSRDGAVLPPEHTGYRFSWGSVPVRKLKGMNANCRQKMEGDS